MDHDFWIERWSRDEIGFHMDERHEFLHQYYHRLHVGPETVFVPLCGKSPDLLWLRQQGAKVLGVELSELAVRAFFAENGLDAEIDESGAIPRFHSAGVTLFQGDLFQLSPDDFRHVRAVYDRGSLVALPPPMRREYADFLCRSLPIDSRILMVGYDYDQAELPGPPFAVPLPEIEQLFGMTFQLELLAQHDALPSHHLLRQRGLSRLIEYACLLTHRST